MAAGRRASTRRHDSSQASLTRNAPGRPAAKAAAPPLLPPPPPSLCSGSWKLLPGFQAVGVPSPFRTTYLYSTWLPALRARERRRRACARSSAPHRREALDGAGSVRWERRAGLAALPGMQARA